MDVEPVGRWFFASSSTSGKGRELAARPHPALGFYWPRRGRQIRIRGKVTPASAADFLARPPGSRAEGRADRQSDILSDPADQQATISAAEECMASDPRVVAPTWTLYGLLAVEVEFWQAARDRPQSGCATAATTATGSGNSCGREPATTPPASCGSTPGQRRATS
jgi:pyridoxamine 5'-phosphate oxidase